MSYLRVATSTELWALPQELERTKRVRDCHVWIVMRPTIALTSTVASVDSSFLIWCEYHLRVVDYIFVWLDNPADFERAFTFEQERVIVQKGAQNGCQSPLTALLRRQENNVNAALSLCRSFNVDWLFHIDSDELIYLDKKDDSSRWSELADPSVGHVKLLNHEVCPVWETTNHFVDCQHFKLNGQLKFNFYSNGKAAVRCAPRVRAAGVHAFAEYQGCNIQSVSFVVLHYACASFDLWKQKYALLGDFPSFWYDNPSLPITLTFHLESRDVYQRCAKRGEWSEAHELFRRQIFSIIELSRLVAEGKVAAFEPISRCFQSRWL